VLAPSVSVTASVAARYPGRSARTVAAPAARPVSSKWPLASLVACAVPTLIVAPSSAAVPDAARTVPDRVAFPWFGSGPDSLPQAGDRKRAAASAAGRRNRLVMAGSPR
jgi:hypothetical protein